MGALIYGNRFLGFYCFQLPIEILHSSNFDLCHYKFESCRKDASVNSIAYWKQNLIFRTHSVINEPFYQDPGKIKISFDFLEKNPRLVSPPHFEHDISWFHLISHFIFYKLTKFYCLIAFTFRDIGKYVYCNYLFPSLNILRTKRAFKVK